MGHIGLETAVTGFRRTLRHLGIKSDGIGGVCGVGCGEVRGARGGGIGLTIGGGVLRVRVGGVPRLCGARARTFLGGEGRVSPERAPTRVRRRCYGGRRVGRFSNLAQSPTGRGSKGYKVRRVARLARAAEPSVYTVAISPACGASVGHGRVRFSVGGLRRRRGVCSRRKGTRRFEPTAPTRRFARCGAGRHTAGQARICRARRERAVWLALSAN